MIGKLLGNRYEIIEKIGGGGMALVYKARCRLLNRYVAVKVLRPEFTSDEDFIDKFGKESQAAASLSHPNIVNVYDVGNDNDIYYIVMEYVDGKTLKKYIKENGRLNNEEIINISKQIALALDHAHSNHIVHRDIKPHNILITNDGRAKVTDFGIARAITSSTVTNTGNVIGSVHYFSPEQARGGYVDEKSDLYSLGVTMYEMITGRVPFSGDTPITVALKHLKEELVPPSFINKNVSESLESIVIKSLQKDKSKRYDSAINLYNDLDKSLNNPSQKLAVFEDDDSPTRVIPSIDDIDTDDDYDDNIIPTKRNKSTMFIGIAAAFIVSIILVIGIFYNIFKDEFLIKELSVPDVQNLSYEIAKQKLEEEGLTVEVLQESYNKEIEKGYVITQQPESGKLVKEGYPVKLTISKGKQKVAVPNLVFKDIDEAEIILQNEDLKIGELQEKYDDLPVGTVIEHSPIANSEVDEDSEIDLIVSKGPEIKKYIMPNLVDKNIDNAKDAIKTLGLILNNVDYVHDDVISKDNIISQSIKPSIEVSEKTVISLVVSLGPENVELPNEETNPTDSSNKKLGIPLDKFENDAELVKVYKVENDNETIIYSKLHKKEEKMIEIPVTGVGKVNFKVYFGEKFFGSVNVDFN